MNFICNFLADEDAATIAEYALMLGFVLVAVTTIVTSFGTRIKSSISKSGTVLPT